MRYREQSLIVRTGIMLDYARVGDLSIFETEILNHSNKNRLWDFLFGLTTFQKYSWLKKLKTL